MSASLTEQFRQFVASKPADERYNFLSHNGCAFAQFLIDAGYSERPMCAADGWTDRAGIEHPQPDGLEEALAAYPWTFGALAERLNAAAA